MGSRNSFRGAFNADPTRCYWWWTRWLCCSISGSRRRKWRSCLSKQKVDSEAPVCCGDAFPQKHSFMSQRVVSEHKKWTRLGVSFGNPTIEIDKLRDRKNKVIDTLSADLVDLPRNAKSQLSKPSQNSNPPTPSVSKEMIVNSRRW